MRTLGPLLGASRVVKESKSVAIDHAGESGVSSYRATAQVTTFDSPESLAGYQAINPSLVERAVTLMEQQARHRMSEERRAGTVTAVLRVGGMLCALTISLGGLYAIVRIGTIGTAWGITCAAAAAILNAAMIGASRDASKANN